MMRRLLVTAVTLLISVAHAQFLAPNENLVAEGILPIPNELAEKVNAFGNFPSASMAAWHPAQNAMLIRARDKSTSQLFMLSKPGLGADEALMIQTNEMARTLAILQARAI